jgi:PIN domain nuclease of toxin-antitoxin system
VKVLLDTHAFLWWVADDERLPAKARRLISDGRNEVLVSAVSGWEIAVTSALGRLELPDPPDRFVPQQLRDNAFETLPITMSHALAVSRLPDLHRDPFDRLLIAQALLEGLTLVSGDQQIGRYPNVRVAW